MKALMSVLMRARPVAFDMEIATVGSLRLRTTGRVSILAVCLFQSFTPSFEEHGANSQLSSRT